MRYGFGCFLLRNFVLQGIRTSASVQFLRRIKKAVSRAFAAHIRKSDSVKRCRKETPDAGKHILSFKKIWFGDCGLYCRAKENRQTPCRLVEGISGKAECLRKKTKPVLPWRMVSMERYAGADRGRVSTPTKGMPGLRFLQIGRSVL